jgi:ribosomal protein L16 Arg81 hydroxylase
MELNPKGHPNARRSKIDWTTLDRAMKETGQPITHARVSEVVLQAGDLLYLPTYWFHYVVSLNTNYECNSRFAASFENNEHIINCGFHQAHKKQS